MTAVWVNIIDIYSLLTTQSCPLLYNEEALPFHESSARNKIIMDKNSKKQKYRDNTPEIDLAVNTVNMYISNNIKSFQ